MSSEPRLILFDDRQARRWEPFSLTRPLSHLLFGAHRLGIRSADALGLQVEAVLTDPILSGLEAKGLPPCRAWEDAPSEGDRVFLSSRVVLPASGLPSLPAQGILKVDGAVVGWVIPGDGPTPQAQDFLTPERWLPAGATVDLPGILLQWPWDLMARNGAQLEQDLEGAAPVVRGDSLPEGVSLLGECALTLGSGVTFEPGVVLDCRSGPIHLADHVTVRAFTRLAGPAWIGPGTTLLGGDISGVSVGTTCKLRGEISDSILGDFVNKAHDGHLGHALLGDWVNLGAGTTNSDLKNNYGPVRVVMEGGEVDTGLIKVGCFLGDHVKTGIGTLLPTGAIVGAGSNVFGGGLAGRRIPPFTWAGPPPHVRYALEPFLANTATAMARRDQSLSSSDRGVLTRLWEGTRRP